MPFGQIVIGPPGSGKTTYVNGMQQYLRSTGRKIAVVNLDPANDVLPYQPDIDIMELVSLDEVMQELKLGPNGGLVYCMDFVEQNLDWLREKLAPYETDNCYFIFDCPGQVELFTQHASFKHIVDALTQAAHYRLTAVHLVDAHLCTEPAKYISALVLSLSTMLHLELPHVNVLSKVDLIRHYGRLDFNLDFYTEVQDLSYLIRAMGSDPFSVKYRKLSKGLCELVEDYGLVRFVPLAIEDKQSVQYILGLVDKANGALYASLDNPNAPIPAEMVYGSTSKAADEDIWTMYQEKYLEGPPIQERPIPQ
eukprot:jgi/Chrzof1/9357/UNPLg00328.t1